MEQKVFILKHKICLFSLLMSFGLRVKFKLELNLFQVLAI